MPFSGGSGSFKTPRLDVKALKVRHQVDQAVGHDALEAFLSVLLSWATSSELLTSETGLSCIQSALIRRSFSPLVQRREACIKHLLAGLTSHAEYPFSFFIAHPPFSPNHCVTPTRPLSIIHLADHRPLGLVVSAHSRVQTTIIIAPLPCIASRSIITSAPLYFLFPRKSTFGIGSNIVDFDWVFPQRIFFPASK